MYKLVISDDEGHATVVPLLRDEITIGRQEGNTIRLTERNVSRLHARLLKRNGAYIVEDLGSYNGVIVNGTPIGMHPNVDDAPFPASQLRRNWIVFDAVFNPEQTLLVKEARQRGCRVVTGVDLFIRRAGLQFKVFTEEDPPVDEMRLALKRAIGAAKVFDLLAW